jgi:uncharacterized protein YbjT (DUF2867 family)
MHVILGGTGHVGSAVTEALLSRGETVTVVAPHRNKARSLEERGAHIEAVDVRDADALRHVYEQGERLFMLNPPAGPSTDTQAQERETVASMLRALANPSDIPRRTSRARSPPRSVAESGWKPFPSRRGYPRSNRRGFRSGLQPPTQT